MLTHDARVQAPPLENYTDTPIFNTKAVVHQAGVPAPTLRAWERRYGILTPHRGENDYRLYSERDIAIITWLRARIESGLTISQAVALLRSLEPTRRVRRRTRPNEPATYDARETETIARQASAPISTSQVTPALSLPDLSTALLHACIALDESAASRITSQAFAVYSVEEICLSVFQPTLRRIGELWSDGTVTVTVEHFTSALIRARLESLFRAEPLAATGPVALVGCAPSELHEIGSLMLALFLRRAGMRVLYLGQSLEMHHLITTIETVKPSCVMLSAALRQHAETLIEIKQRLAALDAPRPTVFLGGLAFDSEPPLARRAGDAYMMGLDAHTAALEIKRRLTA